MTDSNTGAMHIATAFVAKETPRGSSIKLTENAWKHPSPFTRAGATRPREENP